MNKLLTCGVLAALGLTSVALAQTPTPQGTPPNPAPATSPAEGTAADKTEPGRTPTQGAASDAATDPRPATNPAEGTAADRTPPGNTQTTRGTQGQAVMGQDSKLVGAKVVTPADAPLGSVVDVVFDSKGQPAFVVIQSQSDMAAVPFSTASSMMKGDKVVMDEWRFERAPKVKQGEWRSQSGGTWKNDAAKYWEKG
jgi:hypothetical protein